MQYIGNIDINLFKAIFPNIITDQVVFTDKQKAHINERHPEILNKFEKYFSQIIENPDYILIDNMRNNTALLLKTIVETGNNNSIVGSVNLVLRLAVEDDDKNNKNSIITCIPIGQTRLKSYINNGKIVYKRE